MRRTKIFLFILLCTLSICSLSYSQQINYQEYVYGKEKRYENFRISLKLYSDKKYILKIKSTSDYAPDLIHTSYISYGEYYSLGDTIHLTDSINSNIKYLFKKSRHGLTVIKGNSFLLKNKIHLKEIYNSIVMDYRKLEDFHNLENCDKLYNRITANLKLDTLYVNTESYCIKLKNGSLTVRYLDHIIFEGKYQLVENCIKFYDPNLDAEFELRISNKGTLIPIKFIYCNYCEFSPIGLMRK